MSEHLKREAGKAIIQRQNCKKGLAHLCCSGFSLDVTRQTSSEQEREHVTRETWIHSGFNRITLDVILFCHCYEDFLP